MSKAIETDSETGQAGDTTVEDFRQDRIAERRRRWRTVALWSTIIGLFSGYMVLLPVAEAVIEANKPVVSCRVVEDMSVAERVRLRSAELFGVAWFFAVGASIGSFLNVVAYRSPQGKSLGGSSHCPYCNVRITRRDNVPIFGWLMLGGRCRVCRHPISPRYLFVEALTGGLFLLFLFVELLSGGANIPFGRFHSYAGFVWIIFYPKWDVLGMYAYHMTLLCFLVVLTLIDWDRARISKRLILAGGVAGVVFPAIWPDLHPVAWWMPRPDWLGNWPWLERFDTSLIGAVAGVGLGAILGAGAWLRSSSQDAGRVRSAAAASMVLVGLFLGWQAAVSVAVFATVFQLLGGVLGYLGLRIANLPVSGWVLMSTVLHLCLWRVLSRFSFWPGPSSSVLTICVACTGIAVVCVLSRLLSRSCRAAAADVPVNEGVLS